MTFWAVEVKPGEPYILKSSRRGRLRITQVVLGNLESVGWSTIECSVGGKMPVRLCRLNSTSGMCRLGLEYDKEQNVVFYVTGDSSVHLSGYYKIPDAAAKVRAIVTQSQKDGDRETTHVHGIAQEHNAQDTELHNDGTSQMVGQAGLNTAANGQALVTQSQEAGDRETIHVHGIAQEHSALDTEVHNDGTNQMVGQAGHNAAANVQVLVRQSQEDDDNETTRAHDIAQGQNAIETDVHNDGPNQMVGQSGLNMKMSEEASLGSGDVGGPIDGLKIDELKLGDCNAKIASDGKEVTVKYIGMLKDGKVVDSCKGRPAIYTFTLGVDKIIDGWHQGIQGMHVGGKRKLTIPPALGYKDKPQMESQKKTKKTPHQPEKEIIPANSWLVYEIELLEVSEPGAKPKKKCRSVNHH